MLQSNIEKNFPCKLCEKSFTTLGNLKRHINVHHEGHKDYSCDSCGKHFSQAATLKRHIHTIHEGQKDYKCDSCDKLFFHAHQLKSHIQKIHADVKKLLSSDSYEQSFSNPANLNFENSNSNLSFEEVTLSKNHNPNDKTKIKAQWAGKLKKSPSQKTCQIKKINFTKFFLV